MTKACTKAFMLQNTCGISTKNGKFTDLHAARWTADILSPPIKRVSVLFVTPIFIKGVQSEQSG